MEHRDAPTIQDRGGHWVVLGPDGEVLSEHEHEASAVAECERLARPTEPDEEDEAISAHPDNVGG